METNLRQNLLEECFAMVQFLSTYGKKIPEGSASILNVELKDLKSLDIPDGDVLKLHRTLSKEIAPAHPDTVWLIYKEARTNRWFHFLGPVGLVRRLMLIALVSLFFFIALSLSPQINFENIKHGIYTLSGTKLLIIMAFYLTSASLGASFSNLFKANQYIVKNTYDPKYESSYWIRFVLGIIAGIMLAVVIPLPEGVDAGAPLAVASRPILAMLGGFSAALVYRIILRMVYAVESLFVGKQSELTDQKIAELKSINDIEMSNERIQFINQLLHIQTLISEGKQVKDIDDKIQKLITELTNA